MVGAHRHWFPILDCSRTFHLAEKDDTSTYRGAAVTVRLSTGRLLAAELSGARDGLQSGQEQASGSPSHPTLCQCLHPMYQKHL